MCVYGIVCVCVCVCVSPSEHRVVWLLLLLLMLLADVQRGQVHPQQLGNALPAVDVPVLI